MKTIKYLIFFIGGFALISSYLLSQANDIPWVLSLLSPEYVSAQKGLIELENLDSLSVDDEGFKEIAELWSYQLNLKDNSIPITWEHTDLISYKGSQGSYATKLGIVTKMPIEFRMNNGQVLQWDMTPLQENIEGLKKVDFSLWGKIFFILGLFLYVIQFIISTIENKKQHF